MSLGYMNEHNYAKTHGNYANKTKLLHFGDSKPGGNDTDNI